MHMVDDLPKPHSTRCFPVEGLLFSSLDYYDLRANHYS